VKQFRTELRPALAGIIAIVALAVGATPGSALPEASPLTPALVEAARKEGKVVFYTAVDVEVAEKVGAAFRAKYSGIEIQVERSGSERLFQRVTQEYGSSIHNVDVINTSDAAHYILWKRQGLLAPHVPEDVAKHFGDNADPDGLYATWRATLSPLAYNTKFIKPGEAPKSFADLLDPKWKGLMVKAHPGYSGTILTATAQISRELGWDYLRKLGQQRVMQVQSSTEPPKKLAVGERPIMADGNEYNLFTLKEAGNPVEIVYPAEGTPFIPSPSAVMAKAPNPNAARLLQSFLFSAEMQQLLVDAGGLRSLHPATKEPAGRKPLKEIKLMRDDPAAVVDKVEEIKANYAKAFGT
jgi:iron(III) transport system substrate-binding protein